MPEDYQIHLNFLPVTGEFPAFEVFCKLQSNNSTEHTDRTVRTYTLPSGTADLGQRTTYSVALRERPGFERIVIRAGDNNDLTKWVLFESLRKNVQTKLRHHEFWIPERGFLSEIHLIMTKHPEGEEQLIVQPYLLKSVGKFGFLVDFHFRVGEGIVFSRRIQQLSLTLDKNLKRNLDFYAERTGKILRFVRDRWDVLSKISLPGAKDPINISQDFEALPADRLRGRVYVFGANKESRNQFSGLRDFGPLKPVEKRSRLVFIFRENDRSVARKLALALRGNKDRERFSFPGFEKLFRSPVDIDPNPISVDSFERGEMERALDKVRRLDGLVLPIVILPQDDQAAYLEHKAVFTSLGVPTQVCTIDVIENDTTLKWAVANIALQLFCKAGGFPWKVRPTIGAERGLIVGISQSHKTKIVNGSVKVEKHFAFSVMTDSSGLFQKIKVLGNSDVEADYLTQLRVNLEQLLRDEGKDFRRVVIHTSFKLKRREMDEVQNAIQKAAKTTGDDQTKFAVVKVNHKCRFFGINKNVNSLVPFEATRVKLGAGEYLVWFEGIFPEKPTVSKAFPGPTHLQVLRVNDEKQIGDETLLQELVNLSGANWRGFNAKSAPISVLYCHLVADLVHDFHNRGLPLPAVEDLRPWFL